MFGRKELAHLFAITLILGFVFGFDDGSSTFVLNNWLVNFGSACFIVFISLFFKEIVMKLFAMRYRTRVEIELWCAKQFWFSRASKFERFKMKRGLPLGIFLALYLSFLSFGRIFFTAVFNHQLTEDRNARIGRSWKRLTEYEEAMIMLVGFLASMLLVIAAKILDFGRLYDVNLWLIVFNLLPISRLDGSKMFFSSRPMYIFFVAFFIVFVLLLKLGFIVSLIAGVITAAALLVMYWWKYEV